MSTYRGFNTREGSRFNPIILDDDEELGIHSRYTPEFETFGTAQAERLDFMKNIEDSSYRCVPTNNNSTKSLSTMTQSGNNHKVTPVRVEEKAPQSILNFHDSERHGDLDWDFDEEDEMHRRNYEAEQNRLKAQSDRTPRNENTPAQFLDALRNPENTRSGDILKDYEERMRSRATESNATTLSHSKKTLAAESDNKSQTKKVAVPQYGPASHLFASPFDYARDSDKKIASPSPYRNFGSPSPQATVMAKEETQPIRDQSRIDIPKYGPASHLFVSRFSQSLDIGEKSATTSTTTAESTSAKTATSNKRQHVDYEEEDELYETEPEKYDSDSSDGGYHYGPRTPKRRRRNKNNSSRWARRF